MKEVIALLLLVISATLTGCSDYPKPMTKAKGDYLCLHEGGVYYYGQAQTRMQCNSGKTLTYEEWSGITLPEEYWVKGK